MSSTAPDEWEERGTDTGLDTSPETSLKGSLGTGILLGVWKQKEQFTLQLQMTFVH